MLMTAVAAVAVAAVADAAAAAAAAALNRVFWVGEFRASHDPTHGSLVGRPSLTPAGAVPYETSANLAYLTAEA